MDNGLSGLPGSSCPNITIQWIGSMLSTPATMAAGNTASHRAVTTTVLISAVFPPFYCSRPNTGISEEYAPSGRVEPRPRFSRLCS